MIEQQLKLKQAANQQVAMVAGNPRKFGDFDHSDC